MGGVLWKTLSAIRASHQGRNCGAGNPLLAFQYRQFHLKINCRERSGPAVVGHRAGGGLARGRDVPELAALRREPARRVLPSLVRRGRRGGGTQPLPGIELSPRVL